LKNFKFEKSTKQRLANGNQNAGKTAQKIKNPETHEKPKNQEKIKTRKRVVEHRKRGGFPISRPLQDAMHLACSGATFGPQLFNITMTLSFCY
jgi:hypothetical protein